MYESVTNSQILNVSRFFIPQTLSKRFQGSRPRYFHFRKAMHLHYDVSALKMSRDKLRILLSSVNHQSTKKTKDTSAIG